MKRPLTDRSRKLQYEPLERREVMAAGITASFSAGTLNIFGTSGNDQINLRQTGGKISVVNVSGTWLASDVKSILINVKNGNDIVSLNSTANGGNQKLAEDISVFSGSGTDRVRLADGREAVFSGLGHTFKLTASGATTLDGKAWSGTTPTPTPTPSPTPTPKPGPKTNWFDTTVKDAALRTLGSSLFQDGLIDRADLIALLRNVKDGNLVDKSEMTDLNAIVSNKSLFGSLNYVSTISTYIVSGSVANAKYLGTALGNLVAGSSGDHLEKLIGKWLLGYDRPTASGTYRQIAGQLFVNGASYTDIKQGYVGDCYFMSSLAEVALKKPTAISSMFTVNGDGTYGVRFYNGTQVAYVTVDSYLPTNGSNSVIYAGLGMNAANANNELWTALAEKAYVQLNEMGWECAGMQGSGQNSYDAISGGYVYAAMGHITGESTVRFSSTTAATGFQSFVTAFNQGKMIGFASKSTPASTSVVGNHAYAVVGFNATTQTVTLFNPWGTGYAMVTMSWSQIQLNFSYFDRTA